MEETRFAYLVFSSRLIINPTLPSLPPSLHQTCSIISIAIGWFSLKQIQSEQEDKYIQVQIWLDFAQKKSLIQLYDLWEMKLYIVPKQRHMVGYSIYLCNGMIVIEKPLPSISFSLPTQIITCCQPQVPFFSADCFRGILTTLKIWIECLNMQTTDNSAINFIV